MTGVRRKRRTNLWLHKSKRCRIQAENTKSPFKCLYKIPSTPKKIPKTAKYDTHKCAPSQQSYRKKLNFDNIEENNTMNTNNPDKISHDQDSILKY